MASPTKSLEVIVLAAGKGTRMRSDIPKVLHQIGGRPLLAHVLDTAHALDAGRVHVVYGHGGEQVPATIGDRVLVPIPDSGNAAGYGNAG